MRIQFCCGGNRLDGWNNHDADCDITRALPFPDGCADAVFIEHGLEHVSPPDGLRFLIEAHRILKNRGILRVCVPVLDRLSMEHARDIIWGHGHLTAFNSNLLKQLVCIAGFKPENVQFSPRSEIDSHWKAIGIEKDDLESCRVEAVK